jgi:DNA repair protein RadC
MRKPKQLALPFDDPCQVSPLLHLEASPPQLAGLKEASQLQVLGLSNKDSVVLDIILELGERYKQELVPNSQPLRHPVQVQEFSEKRLRGLQKHGYLLILVDTKSQVSHTHFYDTTPLVRTVLRRAVARTAAAFFIVRNGCSEPNFTALDNTLIEQLRQDGEVVGIHLVDFLVIGGGKYRSAREEGLL